VWALALFANRQEAGAKRSAPAYRLLTAAYCTGGQGLSAKAAKPKSHSILSMAETVDFIYQIKIWRQHNPNLI
jgi:hypothetical protein